MTIYHLNTDQRYELHEVSGNFFIKNDQYKAVRAKNDLHSVTWDLIDWIRLSNFTNLSDDDHRALQRISATQHLPDKESIMNIICGRKLNRVFYEQAYNLIHEGYTENKNKTVLLDNEKNFFLYEEILQLLKYSPLKIRSN
jgi:hypothetical protein